MGSTTTDKREHSLLRFTGTLCGRNAEILVDGGASHNVVSVEWLRRHDIRGQVSGDAREIKLGNGEVSSMREKVNNTKYSLICFLVSVLGLYWKACD